MNAVLSAIGKGAATAANANRDAGDEIKSRYSPELVIALSGPVGCGIQHVRDVIATSLIAHGYDVVHVKVSESFKKLAADLAIDDPTTNFSGEFDRISKFQDLGNTLRSELGDDLGAQIALSSIAHDRAERHPGVPVGDIRPGRVAYVIDQLKNPKEAMLLRDIYGNMFYLVGVLTGYERRKLNLTKAMSPADAEALIERDRAEAAGGGQQLEKTLKLADYFIRNSHDNTNELAGPVDRFIGLLHGKNGVTPTVNERGMFAAFSAALRSACLSRQVGASIVDANGSIVATGCNDVPKGGGGLYETGGADHRCVFQEGGLCFNDQYKDKLRDEILQVLKSNGVEHVQAEKLAKDIRANTRLRDLIEFSRAVHAEMDALISAARGGGNGVQGCTLFTTTYPCHNCARHIVAAGIGAVYFIEPYGKSLASELHSDSIDHDADSHRNAQSTAVEKVAFLHFEGVSPRRFADLFYALDSRKDANGRAKAVSPLKAAQKDPELLDNYRQLEAKIVERLARRVGGNDTPRDGAAPASA